MGKQIFETRSFKSEQQLHYENISSFLKWSIGISGTLIASIVAVGIYFTFGSVRDMKTELKEIKTDYNNTVKDLKGQIVDLKNEAGETVNQIRDDSKEAVLSTKNYSENELSRISYTTRQLALTETQKQLDAIFATDKIQNLIQTNAVREIKNKVVDIIADQTKNVGNISDAAAAVRANQYNALPRLIAYFTNPKSQLDSLIAKQLYDQISADIYNQIETQVKADKIDFFASYDMKDIQELRNGYLPANKNLRDNIVQLISIANGEYDLFNATHAVYQLRVLTKIDFDVLDFATVNRWYKNLKKP